MTESVTARSEEPKVRNARFVEHIQNHLKEGQVVVCKICGKTIDEIAKEWDAKAAKVGIT